MKKSLVVFLLLIAPLCRAADDWIAVGAVDDFAAIAAHNVAVYVSVRYAIAGAYLFGSRSLCLDQYGLKAIPQELNNLPELNYLELNDNQIQAIPEELNNLPELWRLYLNGNQIQAIPEGLNLPALRLLDLNGNQIQAIPQELNNLPELNYLELNDNQIQAIPEGLTLPELNYLELNDNQIQAIPEGLTLPALLALYLNGNQIQAIEPRVLDQFRNLRELQLKGNFLREENINALKAYAQRRGNLIIDFGEQKLGRNVKSAQKR